MTAFATIAELATYTGDTALDGVRGDLLLEQASAIIRNHCRQTFDLVSDDEVDLRGNNTARLKLPERPVVSVSAVAINGTATTTYRLVRDTLIRTGPSATQFDATVPGGSWGGPSYTVTVTYTHGFAPGTQAMETLKAICLQVAGRAAGNPQHLHNFAADGVTLGFDRAGPFGLTAAEQSILDRFRHEYAS